MKVNIEKQTSKSYYEMKKHFIILNILKYVSEIFIQII